MKPVLVCLLLGALLLEVNAASFNKASQHLRQPSYQEEKPKDKDEAAVVKVENNVREHHSKVMNAIDKFRAQVCAEMKDEFGVSFKTFSACHKFMKKTCQPGKDMKMDGDRKEVSSGAGFCKEYFPEAEKKAEEEVAKEEKAVKAAAPSPGPFPGPAPAPAPAKAKAEEKAPAPAPKKAMVAKGPAPAGAGPSPGPMNVPGPAPVPAPFIPGISGGKPWGPIAKDEAYYYKKGGKDMSRLHMSEDQKLPTNGYWGKLVEHEDMETSVGDWQQEFGPKSGGAHSAAEACRKYPDNPWCIRKGFGRMRSSSSPAFVHFVALFISLLAASMYQ